MIDLAAMLYCSRLQVTTFAILDATNCALKERQTQSISSKINCRGTSLVAQWLRIHLPTQGTRIQPLAREDPTCCEATKPCATTTEPAL